MMLAIKLSLTFYRTLSTLDARQKENSKSEMPWSATSDSGNPGVDAREEVRVEPGVKACAEIVLAVDSLDKKSINVPKGNETKQNEINIAKHCFHSL